MSEKNKDYWLEIASISSEIHRLSNEIQAPLIEEHITEEQADEMDVSEITEYIAQFYTDEQREQWAMLDTRGALLAIKYEISPFEIANDIWGFSTPASSDPLTSTAH